MPEIIELVGATMNVLDNISKLCVYVNEMFTKYPALKTYVNVSIMAMASDSDELDLCFQSIAARKMKVFKEELEK